MLLRQKEVLVGFLAILIAVAQAKTAEEWKALSIYQVLTDRFATTDLTAPECWIRDYCGGTWKGLERKLDYIQNMGFDAVWISPVIHNIDTNTTWGYAFHGYWGDDPYRLNEHFGSPDDLKSLSDSLHRRGMSLMVDIVINHFASNYEPLDVDYGLFPAPFNTSNAFHQLCNIDYSNQSSIEDCWLVAGSPPVLPDLKSDDPVILNALIDSVVDLVEKYNIDGIRLDTARHVPKSSLSKFQQKVGVFVTGEAVNQSVPFVAQYQGPLDSAINYPLWYGLVDSFMGRTTFDFLTAVVKSEQATFSDAHALTNFLDNHDQPRFASYLGDGHGDDVLRDENAATFLFFVTGIPVIYYGFEQRFDGGYDPINRETMWSSGYNASVPLYNYIARLNAIRKYAASIVGKDKFYSEDTVFLGSSVTHMVMQRGPLVIVLNNCGEHIIDTGYTVSGSQFKAGDSLTDLVSCEVVKVGRYGMFVSPSNGGKARIWMEREYASKFCPY
ncbi:alpha-amylase [Lipomyces tetrasporus]|uniref:Alpha-amylase n=1 Tax=Lipomyces tetrasporus TaxID=54092 RepID=A0AAD7QND6_9ASCO|nr:alpha-amylase [Lipomyces tetrasporus]KAJ8098479.1 alpha-amylase [Lipomyces tetrasporus]